MCLKTNMKLKKTDDASGYTTKVRDVAVVNLTASDAIGGISRPAGISTNTTQSINVKGSNSKLIESVITKTGWKSDINIPIAIFTPPPPPLIVLPPLPPVPPVVVEPGSRVNMAIIANRGLGSDPHRAVGVDLSGNVYFPMWDPITQTHSVQRLNQDTGVRTNIGSVGQECLAISCEADGYVYIADTSNSRVLKFNPVTSAMTVIAGGNGVGNSGNGGLATAAQLNAPSDVKRDSNGNIYISDWIDCSIRKINSAGIITKFAGSDGPGARRPPYVDDRGDGSPALSSNISSPFAMAIDSQDNIYVTGQYRILGGSMFDSIDYVKKIDAVTTIVSTVVGNGQSAGFNGDGLIATSTRLYTPMGLAFDSSDNLYVSDSTNNRVLKIDAVSRIATRYAGDPTTNLGFTRCQKIAIDTNGNLYINDYLTKNIYKVLSYSTIPAGP